MSHSADLLMIVDKLGSTITQILKSPNRWYDKVGQVVEAIVPEIEKIGETWKGAEKKTLAMEVTEELYFKYLNSKYIPDFIERMLVRKIASIAIDKFVALMNKRGIFTHSVVKPS